MVDRFNSDPGCPATVLILNDKLLPSTKRKMEERDEIMKWWDYWRAEIANGHQGSAPRDWFESILDHYEEKLKEVNHENNHTNLGGAVPVRVRP